MKILVRWLLGLVGLTLVGFAIAVLGFALAFRTGIAFLIVLVLLGVATVLLVAALRGR